jgi:VWFA-related protein
VGSFLAALYQRVMLTSKSHRLLAVLLCPTLALAQTAPSTPTTSDNTIRVTTRMVYVDVVVHDTSGHLVRGLTQNDFRVLEDGKPQQIDYFAAHTYDIGAPHPAAPPVAKNVFSNVPVSGPAGSVNIILFDLVNTAAADQQYARKQMLDFLKALPPGQQVALFVLSDQLHLFQSFTGSSDLLVAAAKLINPKDMRLYQSDAEQQRDIDNLGRMQDALGGRDPGQSIQALANEMTFENEQTAEVRQRITITAFAQIASAAAGYPGRKNLFWLSGSFPFSLTLQGQYNITAPLQYSTLNMPDLPVADVNAVANTAKVIANAQIAVYPISAIGLEVGGVGVEVSGNSMAALSSSSGISNNGNGSGNVHHTLEDTQAQQFTNRSTLRGAMNDIAYETGGEAVFGSNDLAGALRRSIEDGSNYYTLAYRPQNRDWNGKFRAIKVEMPSRSYSLSYRRGYFANADQGTSEDTAQALNAALHPGAPESTLLLLKGKIDLPGAQQPDVHVETTVNAAGVDFSTDAAGHRHAKLLVLLVALNDSPTIGAATQPENPPQTSGVIRLDLDPEAYAAVLKDGIRFQQKLALKPGRYRMRLGVSDMNNNRLGTLDMPVEIAPQSTGGN